MTIYPQVPLQDKVVQGAMAQVLVVCDEQTLRRLLQLVLEHAGHTVTACESATSAQEMLSTSPGPLVVLLATLTPPGAITRLLQAAVTEPAISRHAFIAITAYPEGIPFTLQFLLTEISAPIIGKPFEVENLLDCVAQAEQRLHANKSDTPA